MVSARLACEGCVVKNKLNTTSCSSTYFLCQNQNVIVVEFVISMWVNPDLVHVQSSPTYHCTSHIMTSQPARWACAPWSVGRHCNKYWKRNATRQLHHTSNHTVARIPPRQTRGTEVRWELACGRATQGPARRVPA